MEYQVPRYTSGVSVGVAAELTLRDKRRRVVCFATLSAGQSTPIPNDVCTIEVYPESVGLTWIQQLPEDAIL